MKKLFVILVILLAAISCSKKTTSTKTKGTETPPIVIKDPAESSIKAKMDVEPKKSDSSRLKALPLPTKEKEDAATQEKISTTLRAAGKEAYSVKCNKCHDGFEPSKYTAARWEKLVDWMAPRAKLEAHEKEAILAYVKYNAKK